jgi:hypothetical protein
MLCTYRATLRGQALEWADRPPHLRPEVPVEVHITILDDIAAPAEATNRGQRMAETLEQLVRLESRTTPVNPADWERNIRQERALPGRDASPAR